MKRTLLKRVIAIAMTALMVCGLSACGNRQDASSPHGRNPVGLSLCPEGGGMVPRKPKRPCSFPGCPNLTEDGSVRNTRNKRTAAMRSMTGTRLYAVGTAGRGNESVTAMRQGIHSVKSAKGKDDCAPWRRYITRCLYPKAAPMRRAIWFPFAKSATPEYMLSVVTDGIKIKRSIHNRIVRLIFKV